MKARTILRLELLIKHDRLFYEDNGINDTTGWVCHCSRDFVQKIELNDVIKFIRESFKQLKINRYTEQQIKTAAVSVYNQYAFNFEDRFVILLKSNTEMDRSEDNMSFFKKILKRIW